MKFQKSVIGASLFFLSGCGPELAMFLSGLNSGMSNYSSPGYSPYMAQQAYNQGLRDLTAGMSGMFGGRMETGGNTYIIQPPSYLPSQSMTFLRAAPVVPTVRQPPSYAPPTYTPPPAASEQPVPSSVGWWKPPAATSRPPSQAQPVQSGRPPPTYRPTQPASPRPIASSPIIPASSCVSDTTSGGHTIIITNRCEKAVAWKMCVNVAGRNFRDYPAGVTASGSSSRYTLRLNPGESVRYAYNVSYDDSGAPPSC